MRIIVLFFITASFMSGCDIFTDNGRSDTFIIKAADFTLTSVNDNIVRLKMHNTCWGCTIHQKDRIKKTGTTYYIISTGRRTEDPCLATCFPYQREYEIELTKEGDYEFIYGTPDDSEHRIKYSYQTK